MRAVLVATSLAKGAQVTGHVRCLCADPRQTHDCSFSRAVVPHVQRRLPHRLGARARLPLGGCSGAAVLARCGHGNVLRVFETVARGEAGQHAKNGLHARVRALNLERLACRCRSAAPITRARPMRSYHEAQHPLVYSQLILSPPHMLHHAFICGKSTLISLVRGQCWRPLPPTSHELSVSIMPFLTNQIRRLFAAARRTHLPMARQLQWRGLVGDVRVNECCLDRQHIALADHGRDAAVAPLRLRVSLGGRGAAERLGRVDTGQIRPRAALDMIGPVF